MPEVGVNPQVNNQPAGVPASTTTKSRRSYVSILIGVLAVVIAALAIWIGYKALTTTTSTPSSAPTSVNNTTAVPEIKSDADFQKLEDEVNNTDLDTLTKDLDQNDTDAGEF